MATHFLGIDIGTSACKVILIDALGSVVARAVHGYPLTTPQPGWSEQDPEHWWDAAQLGVMQALKALDDRSSVVGIGLSGQMHGLTALDERQRVLRPAMLWCDQRAAPQCEEITERAGGLPGLLALVQNRMLPGFTAGKIIWMRQHEPVLFERMRHLLNPKDYIRLRMTGEHATDVSDASGTGLFDTRSRQWSYDLLDRLGIATSLLPKVYESPELTGYLQPALAQKWGLPADTPVFGGGGDSVIQTTSMGIIDHGDTGVTLGTAGIVAAGTSSFPTNPDGRLQISCGNEAGRWHVMGVSLGGGSALQWMRQAVAPLQSGGEQPSFAFLVELARQAQPATNGLLFLPYLMGERCPHVAPEARGAWIGLTQKHDAHDLVRSVIEGVLQNISQIVDLFVDAGIPVNKILASGGATAEPFWLRLLADVLQREVRIVTGAAEGGAYGAALIAGLGAGHWTSLAEAVAVAKTTESIAPDPQLAEVYSSQAGDYRALFDALNPVFKRLSGPMP